MQQARSVSFSERLYRALLFVYPHEFRRAYRFEMVQTFRDCYRDITRYGSAGELLRFWSYIISDLVLTASVEQYKALRKRILGIERDHFMLQHPFHIEIAQRTDIGRRAENDDQVAHVLPEDEQVLSQKGALFIVADGMAGHNAAITASQLAVDTIREVYYQDPSDDPVAALVHAIQSAHQQIQQKAAQDEAMKDMGTTAVAAVLRGDTLYGANVGDSRAYVVRNGQARQLSVDHSVVAEKVRKGEITDEEARTHPERNKIYRCLGYQEIAEADTFTEPVQNGDYIVLCTDGLTYRVYDREIAATVEQYGPEESTALLIAMANERGGDDNVSALVVRVSL